jgi:hypothetical protein
MSQCPRRGSAESRGTLKSGDRLLAEYVRAEGPGRRHGRVAQVRQAEDVLDGAQQRVVVVRDGADGTGPDERGQQDRADAAAAGEVYQAVARTPTPAPDRPFRGLSNAANYSRLWLGIEVFPTTFT